MEHDVLNKLHIQVQQDVHHCRTHLLTHYEHACLDGRSFELCPIHNWGTQLDETPKERLGQCIVGELRDKSSDNALRIVVQTLLDNYVDYRHRELNRAVIKVHLFLILASTNVVVELGKASQ